MHVSDDTEALQVEHWVIAAHGRFRESSSRCLALVLATGIPRATSDREALGAADNSVESVELGTVDNSVVVFHQDIATGFERVEHYRSSIAQLYLEDWVFVLAPPLLARGSMVFTELEQVAKDWDCSWNFGNALDVANIRAIRPL